MKIQVIFAVQNAQLDSL